MKAAIARYLAWGSEPTDKPTTLYDKVILEVACTMDVSTANLPMRRSDMQCELYVDANTHSWDDVWDTALQLKADGYKTDIEARGDIYGIKVNWAPAARVTPN